MLPLLNLLFPAHLEINQKSDLHPCKSGLYREVPWTDTSRCAVGLAQNWRPGEAAQLIPQVMKLRDRTLVSVLAYAGLRPEEALALEWQHIRARTILD